MTDEDILERSNSFSVMVRTDSTIRSLVNSVYKGLRI